MIMGVQDHLYKVELWMDLKCHSLFHFNGSIIINIQNSYINYRVIPNEIYTLYNTYADAYKHIYEKTATDFLSDQVKIIIIYFIL